MATLLRMILILSLGSFICLAETYAQESQSALTDTSYFLSYDDNFNLIMSTNRGHSENVKLLLNRGVDVNTVTYEGVTALMYAADNGNAELVKLLLENGADPDLKPHNGLTALMSASLNNHFEIAEMLIKMTESPNIKDIYGVTALHYAAAYNYYELVDMLIFYGADPEISDLSGNTPLITASFNNCYEAVDVLLQNGANIDATDNKGNTSLMSAIQENNLEIINILIEKGSDINYTSQAGLSPVILAIIHENADLTERLINMGAKIQQQKGKRLDILHIAMHTRNKQIIDLLLANDIKPLRRPNFSKIALGPALNFNQTDFMNGLNLGILDTKYNTGIYTGFYFRPFANRILFTPMVDTAYQYWERRYYFHAGIEKRFALIGYGKPSHTGPLIGLNEIITYGSYRGSTSRPGTSLITVPAVGWYYANKSFLLRINYEYMNLKTPEIKPGRLNISAFYSFSVTSKKLAPKRILWLN